MSDSRTNTHPAAQGRLADAQDFECPSCGHVGMTTFYAADDIPIHSCLLMSTRQAALHYPTGDMRLGFCRNCGFIANMAFDPGRQQYSQRYEETQAFSKHFNAFLVSLATRMIERYGLRNKQILEIGCGKGEFLVCLCQLGKNKGIGIDPAYVPQRTPPEMTSRVRFIRDLYSEAYAHLTADFVCCRHTLEHIPLTAEFLRLLRRSLGRRTSTVVFFEVPDVMRILREGAFWDIYYEHCSYFTAGSLARLFRSCGFDLLELYRDYGGQYLLITARPGKVPGKGHFDMEEDVEDVIAAVGQFERTVAEGIARWQERIRALVAQGRRLVVWGAGSKCVAFLSAIGLTDHIQAVVDISPYKQGTFVPGTGHKIISPEVLAEDAADCIIVMNPIYCNEISQNLDALEMTAKLLPV